MSFSQEMGISDNNKPPPHAMTPEMVKKCELIMKEHPKLDFIMAYCLASTPIERLREIFAEKVDIKPQEDFVEKSKVTIKNHNEDKK